MKDRAVGSPSLRRVRKTMGDRTPCETSVMLWPQADALESDRLSLEPLAVRHAGEMVTALAPRGLYLFTGGTPLLWTSFARDMNVRHAASPRMEALGG